MIDIGVARHLLRRHVRRRAERGAERGERLPLFGTARGREGFRDSEVRDRARAAGKKNVVRLDVAMHDAVGLRVCECLRDVGENADDFRNRQRSSCEPRPKRLALHERHHVIRQSIDFARAEHRHDVRMLQSCRELDFALEPLGVDSRCELREQHLEHDRAFERVVLGEKDARHSAAAQFSDDRVGGAERFLKLVGEFGGHGPSVPAMWKAQESLVRAMSENRIRTDPPTEYGALS
jgi:hypothetical protein